MLLFRLSDSSPPVAVIARIRKLTSLSLADIRAHIANGEPLVAIEPFGNDWQDSRHLLVELSRAIDGGVLPLSVSESVGGIGASDECPVLPEMLRNLIQQYRETEMETEMHTDLELGRINDPTGFESNDSDWTK